MAKKKKVKKKKVKRGKPPKKPPKPKALGLHGKKLLILEQVPIMLCSVIGRDKQGLRFAHTQAEKVYQIYREKTEKYGLTIRNTELVVTNFKYTDQVKIGHDWKNIEITATLCVGKWEIRDKQTGETEEFGGMALGDNYVWSANSAQTVAKKQALLDYFETAWPQPTDWAKVVRESLEALKGENFTKALKQIMPKQAYDILTATKAIQELTEYYSKGAKECQKPKKSRKSK